MQYLGMILGLLGSLGGGGKSEKPSIVPPQLPMQGGGAGALTANPVMSTNPGTAWKLFGGFA